MSKTILEVVDLVFFLVLARFFKHGLPKLCSTCPEPFFAEFFSQNNNNWHYERKNFIWFCQNCILLFRGTFEQNNSRSRRFGFFSSPSQILEAWDTKTVFYVSRGTFCGVFSQNQFNWYCGRKKLAGFVKNAFYLSGELLSITILEVVELVLFLVLARFFQHGLPKLYSTCPEALFADFFSQNHINWHCEQKNSAGFVKTAFYFSGDLLSKTILEVVDLVFLLVLARFFKHGLLKLCSTCPEPFFADFFSQNHNNWHCERKKLAGFVKNAFYLSGELLSKTILEVVELVLFLVLARFFQHWLPKLYSTCPEALFADFFSQNHINWHCEQKNSAGFVKTAFYFSGDLLSKTILEVVDLVFLLVLARFFKHWLPKLYSTCPEALFAEFFSQNHINWHCERKNSAGFVKTAFYISGELLSKTILEVVELVF